MAFTTHFDSVIWLPSEQKETGLKNKRSRWGLPRRKEVSAVETFTIPKNHAQYNHFKSPHQGSSRALFAFVDHSDYWTDMTMNTTTHRNGRFKQAVSSAWLLIISELPACITDNPWCWLQSPSIIKRISAMKAARDLFSGDKEEWAIE